MSQADFDTIIIGSGVAGLAAGIYAARYMMKTLIVGEELGGATTTAWTVENYPGFKAIDGYDLVLKMKEQVEGLGVEVRDGQVSLIKKENDYFILTIGEKKLTATTVILATGSARRKLGIPNEKELNGKGIHYCTTCDSPLYKGKTIAIIGGGDASVKGANLAAQYAQKVYLITRRADFIAEPVNWERLQKFQNVELVYQTTVESINGTERLESITLNKPVNGAKTLKLDGLFIEIGALPNNQLAKELNITLDQHGYIETNEMMETNLPGALAAGDITNETGHFKQDIVAASQGAIAATAAYNYWSIHQK